MDFPSRPRVLKVGTCSSGQSAASGRYLAEASWMAAQKRGCFVSRSQQEPPKGRESTMATSRAGE